MHATRVRAHRSFHFPRISMAPPLPPPSSPSNHPPQHLFLSLPSCLPTAHQCYLSAHHPHLALRRQRRPAHSPQPQSTHRHSHIRLAHRRRRRNIHRPPHLSCYRRARSRLSPQASSHPSSRSLRCSSSTSGHIMPMPLHVYHRPSASVCPQRYSSDPSSPWIVSLRCSHRQRGHALRHGLLLVLYSSTMPTLPASQKAEISSVFLENYARRVLPASLPGSRVASRPSGESSMIWLITTHRQRRRTRRGSCQHYSQLQDIRGR